MSVAGFESLLREWAAAACEGWGYPAVGEDWIEALNRRLPRGLREAIAAGLSDGSILTRDGHKFSLAGLPPNKGPYAWFSRNPSKQEPAPNWEYFVQVAEFVRLKSQLEPRGYRVFFEDDLMDITTYRDLELLVCCEVKEKASQLNPMLKRLKSYSNGVDLAAADRGNDALRKAKYLLRRRPEYFSLLAIGQRLEFRVSYPGGRKFDLRDDLIWLP